MLAYRKASLPCAAELCSASPSIVVQLFRADEMSGWKA
jgi:hypothetical protein